MRYPLAPRDHWYGDADYVARGGKLVRMAPSKYLAAVRPLDASDATARENIEDLKQHIRDGGELDPLTIYGDGKEDGRHRAHAAKELGIKSVPVLVFPRENKQERPVSKSKKWTRTPEGDLVSPDGHWYIKPERVYRKGRGGGMRKMFALYMAPSHPGNHSKTFKLFAHYLTLKQAKDATGPISGAPWLSNPHKGKRVVLRKNGREVGWLAGGEKLATALNEGQTSLKLGGGVKASASTAGPKWMRVPRRRNPATEKDVDRYRKVLALVERGTGGERDSAAQRLVEMEVKHPGVTALAVKQTEQLVQAAPTAVALLAGPVDAKAKWTPADVLGSVAAVGAQAATAAAPVVERAATAVWEGLNALASAGYTLGMAALEKRLVLKEEQKVKAQEAAPVEPDTAPAKAKRKRKSRGTRITLPPGCRVVCDTAPATNPKRNRSTSYKGVPVQIRAGVVYLMLDPVTGEPARLSFTGIGARAKMQRYVDEALAKTNPRNRSTEVQTLLFPKKRFTPHGAVAWAREHGFTATKVDESSGDYLRLRQKDPAGFAPGKMRTITFGTSGIKAVVGVPK